MHTHTYTRTHIHTHTLTHTHTRIHTHIHKHMSKGNGFWNNFEIFLKILGPRPNTILPRTQMRFGPGPNVIHVLTQVRLWAVMQLGHGPKVTLHETQMLFGSGPLYGWALGDQELKRSNWRWARGPVHVTVNSKWTVFLKNGSKDFLAFLHEGSVQYWPESYTAVCPKKYRFINYSWKQVLAIFGQFLEIGVPATLDIAYSDRYHWAL